MSYENQLNEFEKDLALIGDYKSTCLEKLIEIYGFWEYARGVSLGKFICEGEENFMRKRTDIAEEIYRQILEVIREGKEKAASCGN